MSDAIFFAITSSTFSPLPGDRMRGADVGAGRHGGDVGGDGDQEAGGRGAVPGRPDEHRDRASSPR